jgi:hypothetical protein
MLHVGQKFQSEAVCFTKTLCAHAPANKTPQTSKAKNQRGEARSFEPNYHAINYRDVANRAMGLNHAKKQTSIIKVGNQAMRLHLLTLLAKTSKTLSSNQHRSAASNKKPELDKQLSASRQREAKHRASRPPSLSAVAPQNTQARTTHPSKSTHITDVISAARAHGTDVINVMSAFLLADHAFLRLCWDHH